MRRAATHVTTKSGSIIYQAQKQARGKPWAGDSCKLQKFVAMESRSSAMFVSSRTLHGNVGSQLVWGVCEQSGAA